MSDTSNATVSVSYFPWLLIFLVIKTGGTALATWSWWWLLLPIVPDVVVFCQKLGLI
jgi:hypothetical protein